MKRIVTSAFFLYFMSSIVYSGSLGLSTQKFSRTAAKGVTIGTDTIQVYHVGGAFTQVTFSVSDNAGWLSVTSDNPVCDEYIPAQATVRYATESLAAGTHTGRVSFSSPNTIPPSVTATAVVTILPQSKVIGVSPESFRISLPAYTTNTMTVLMDVWNAGSPGMWHPGSDHRLF